VSLAEVPVILVLVGLAAYTVLGGADFGAGFWQLTRGSGERAKAIRAHAHHVIGPVWEANHVWLIFVLVVCWTAYPRAFGTITTTLAAPLFIAGIGIVLRGTLYALHAATETSVEQRRTELGFAASSILTPFALGTVVGGIVSGRVPADGSGDMTTSWLNSTSVAIGVLAVTVSAYLAAVYLAADAVRSGEREVEDAFRVRALAMAPIAGAAALVGLIVLRHDARTIFDDLTSGAGLVMVLISGLAGVSTIGLVVRRRYSLARVTAAGAVVAVIAGWGIAQQPQFLPGLTIEQAASGHSSLVSVLVALAIGSLLLVPSLGFLFSLVLRGRFDVGAERPAVAVAAPHGARNGGNGAFLAAVGLFAVAALVMLAGDSTAGRIIGVAGLLVAIGVGFVAVGGRLAAAQAEDEVSSST
jgi:cytochrome d ubiquinol oxidase subunit II